MEREPQWTRRRAVLLLRAALLPGWTPKASELLVWATRGAIALGVIALIASVVSKTLWDWLRLLIVPVVLGLGAYLFNRSENRRTRKQADHRREEEVLQAYLEQMWRLLLDKDLRSTSKANSNSEALTAARVSTLITLERIHDSDKKGIIVKFLWMWQRCLLKRPDIVVMLEGANLGEADLGGADLKGAKLEGANLSSANLTGVDLSDANLIGADLRGADLSEASGWTEELEQQADSLEGATMPNGQKYEEWRKDKKAQGKDRKNG